MKLLLKIMYDGSLYSGYQYQPNAATVQGVLTDKISEALGQRCFVTGCSRTDAGVHALGFCAAVEPAQKKDGGAYGDIWCTIPTEKLHRVINPILPNDISVVGACRVEDSFHPRYDARSKEYVYVISDGVCRDPFKFGRAYMLPSCITDDGLLKMREAAQQLVGRHDFSAFMAAGSSVKDTVRTLKRLEVERTDENTVTVTAAADGFLYNMVRILTGTLLDTARGKIDVGSIKEILDSRDRQRAGFTAPPCGLYLKSVDYGQNIEFKAE